MKEQIIFLVLLALSCFFYGADAAPPRTDAAKAPLLVRGEFNSGKGVAVIRGDYDPGKAYASWTNEGEGHVPPPGGERPLQTVTFRQGGSERIYFFSQRDDNGGCEACPPSVSLLALTRVGGDWRVDALEADLLSFGFFGYADEGALVRIGREAQGVLFAGRTGNHGYREGSMELVYECKGEIKVLEVPRTSGDNRDACNDHSGPKCYAYDSKLEAAPGVDPLFFDLKVTTSGTEEQGDHIVKKLQFRRFAFKNGDYIEVPTAH